MDPRIYKLHIENEKEHWWYKGRREIISSIISKFVFKNNKLKILDFGAGSGANTIALSHYGEVYVYEKNENALQLLKKRFEKISNIFVLDAINENIFFDLIIASDVIEHIKNDDEVIEFFSKVFCKYFVAVSWDFFNVCNWYIHICKCRWWELFMFISLLQINCRNCWNA